jgi:hypothetical protein
VQTSKSVHSSDSAASKPLPGADGADSQACDSSSRVSCEFC